MQCDWRGIGRRGMLAIGVLLIGATMASAASLHRSASPANGSGTNGNATGNYLFTWYDIESAPGADNVLRLIDPNGCGNGNTGNAACATEVDQCAMVYVFDDDQEMGECCGCPLTPNELRTLSVGNNLTNNWALSVPDNGSGTIVVVGSAINNPACAFNGSCNGGCDPTVPALTAGPTNVVGSITHENPTGLTELPLFDQGAGDATNNAYLVNECGALNGNSSHVSGFCSCPSIDGLTLGFQGFESNIGDWPPATTQRVTAGGGSEHTSNASGDFHAEIINNHDDSCFASSGVHGFNCDSFSFFEGSSTTPYPGPFSQSIDVFVFANWPPTASPSTPSIPSFWIDMSASDGNTFLTEENFHLTARGSSVDVTLNGDDFSGNPPILTTITASGWYTFQFTYRKGATPTSPVLIDASVLDHSGHVIATTTITTTLQSQNLGGCNYVWFPEWKDGAANDQISIDNEVCHTL